jgi:adenylylsulfate kinase-like enzyme
VGLPGSGRAALAYGLERKLFDLGYVAAVLDPRDARYTDLPERAWPAVWPILARRMADAGLLVIISGDLSAGADRARFAESIGAGRFVEVHVATPDALAAKRSRDPFAALLQGGAFDAPDAPIATVSVEGDALDDSIQAIVDPLKAGGLLKGTEG